VVLATVAATLLAYPVMAALRLPLWPVAVLGGGAAAAACLANGARPATLLQGVAWPVFPFLVGVSVLALGLERIGVVAWLRDLYARSAHPIATIGATSALGSALFNNHPMSVLNVVALERSLHGDVGAFAALVGGDLGPRLLPVGSLASLLWFDVLRKHDVEVRVATFVRIGVVLTVLPLAVSLATLAAVARIVP
jgi:arsenical pump membrane protein